MSYISGDPAPKLIKKEISKGVYRDFLKVTCSKCYKTYESEVKYNLICPFCGEEVEGMSNPLKQEK